MKPIKIESEILDKQKIYLYEKAKSKFGDSSTKEELDSYVNEVLAAYNKLNGGPLLQKRRFEAGELPFIEDYEENNLEINEDLSILFSELNIITNYLVDYFNYAQSEQKRVNGLIKNLNGLVGSLRLITEENTKNAIYFKESFTDYSLVEKEMTVEGNRAQLSTQEGILTLKRTSSINRSLNSKVYNLQGNGQEGTNNLVRRLGLNEDNEIEYKFVSEQTPNNKKESILDYSPDTIFEYQLVNVPQGFKEAGRNYDFEWSKGDKNNDLLRLKLVIELEKAEDLNWININPYYAPNSTSRIKVHSIKTSEDGFDYKGLYENEEFILNTELNSTPQSYRLEDVFTGSTDFKTSKFAGQGVWGFPTRKAKFVEIVLDQSDSYTELIGLETYYKKKKTSSQWTRVPKQNIPQNILEGKTGIYSVDSVTEIKKKIEATEGWRYAIGLRDINLMSYEFEEASEYVSKLYKLEGLYEISEMILYANEKIPEQFTEKIASTNDWITYEVSFDDVTWHEISPMHRQPVKEKEFPAKIIALNGNQSDIEKVFELHKKELKIDKPTQVRLKITLKRPKGTDYKTMTPFVEDYAIKIVTKEERV